MLVFIDQSGDVHPSATTLRPVLAAVCIDQARSRDLSRQMFNMKKRLTENPENFELKGHKLLTRTTFEKRAAKRELVESTFELIRNIDLTLFAIVMERPTVVPLLQPGMLPNQYRYILQRVALLLDAQSHDDMALLIFDGQGPNFGRDLSSAISGFLFKHPEGQSYSRIVETPLFVDSRITPGIQIADMVASCVRHFQENELHRRPLPAGDTFLSAIQRYYRCVQQKSIDLQNDRGVVFHGIYFMPERHLHEERLAEDVGGEVQGLEPNGWTVGTEK
ncbi:MAG: DUF3800 domain-containing protein [Dehalococcoidia bacterium]|nr:DUF3800 domain-containing protein [Dehalococcoidia bacterium]